MKSSNLEFEFEAFAALLAAKEIHQKIQAITGSSDPLLPSGKSSMENLVRRVSRLARLMEGSEFESIFSALEEELISIKDDLPNHLP